MLPHPHSVRADPHNSVTILVTGGAGDIGSHMALELLDSGEDVIVLDDLSTGFAWAVPNGAKFVEGDAGDKSSSSGSYRAIASTP